MAGSKVSYFDTMQALHTFSALALANASLAKPPKWEYGKTSPAFKMTPGNAAPALVVWLFLVTNPMYLQLLDTDNTFDDPATVVNISDISDATNLTVDGVQAILNAYVNPALAGGTLTAAAIQNAFKTVASAFQAFAEGAAYLPGHHCPDDGKIAMLGLANSGANVHPAS